MNEDISNIENQEHVEFWEKYNVIISEIKKLNPYLNNSGKKKLTNIFDKAFSLNLYSPQSSLIIEKASFLNLKKYKLTNTELYICVLISLNFSNIEIVHLSNFSANYIRVTIHRICKKINVENRKELENFLKLENE